MPPNISICLATYKRNAQLKLLLDDLARQTLLPREVVVVDNEPLGGAKAVIEGRRDPYVIKYEVQPQKNISLTRNRTVALAEGDWLAIIDDDERAPANWLQAMAEVMTSADADGVLGHVDCLVPDNAPSWIRKGHFYDSWPNPHGEVFPLNRISKGNALLDGGRVRRLEGPYDPAFGLTGGEDADLYARLVREGAKLVWCDQPRLSEPVDPSRLNARWLLLRAYRGGQDFSRNQRRGDFGPVGPLLQLRHLVEQVLKLAFALILVIATLPFGRHHSMEWLVKAAANWGKLTSLWGWRHKEYA